MPKVTPELLREMGRLSVENSMLYDQNPCRIDYCFGRASAFREIAAMLEENAQQEASLEDEARESAHLVIPHDPNYHCWGK